MSEMRLHDDDGNRLYLNAEERAAFLDAARKRSARDRTLCETLHHTGWGSLRKGAKAYRKRDAGLEASRV